MRNVTKILAATGLLVMSFGLAGCQDVVAPANQKAPDIAVQEGLVKLSALTSYSYNVGLKGDLKGPAGQPPEKVTFDVTVNGAVDTKDIKDPKLNLTLKGSMMADQDGGDADLNFRMNKDSLYLNLKSLNGKGAASIPEELKKEFVGKWWSIAIPAEALSELTKSVPQGGSTETLTPEQQKMRTLVEQTKFFKNVVSAGSENVSGETADHYTGVLDKEAVAGFVVKAAELQGETVSEDDKSEMTKGLDLFDFTGDFYVGRTSGTLLKVKGTLTIKEKAEKDSPTGNVTVEASIGDLNKSVTVEVPADAQPVPMEALSALPL